MDGNQYGDDERAGAYATLDFPGTYHLAFRDLPALLAEHAPGPSAGARSRPDTARRALDFGCGAGRSTRFLKAQGYDAMGIDISAPMLAHARAADPGGRYELVVGADYSVLAGERFDLMLAAFPVQDP